MTTDANSLRIKIDEAVREHAKLDAEVAAEVAFHMTDWINEFDELAALFADPDKFDSEQIYKTILSFLSHAPEHIAEASELMTGDPVEHIFRESKV